MACRALRCWGQRSNWSTLLSPRPLQPVSTPPLHHHKNTLTIQQHHLKSTTTTTIQNSSQATPSSPTDRTPISAPTSPTTHHRTRPIITPSSPTRVRTTVTPPSPTSTRTMTTVIPPSPDNATRRFNVGAFGAGRIGRMHLHNVARHQRLALRWVVDDHQGNVDVAREELFLHETPFRASGDVGELLDDSSLDGVFILTPTETHAGLITQALEKGKAVFVEKPTAQTKDEIEQCYTLAENRGLHLFTGFQRRLDPVMAELYNAVRDRDAVGKVFNIKTVSRDSPKPSYDFLENCDPEGCNILSDMAVHDVDMIVWLTEAEVPEMIYVVTHAHDEVLAKAGVDDSLTVVLKYKSGVIATIDSCRETTYGYDIRVEVFGSKGMVMANNPRETTAVVDGESGGSMRRLFHSFPQRFEKAFQLEVDHFVRCMEGTAQPPVTKDQALMTANIVEKGVQSFREKRPVYF